LQREEGQDLVEYALVVALIAFGAITGMNFLARNINVAFSKIATTLSAAASSRIFACRFSGRCIAEYVWLGAEIKGRIVSWILSDLHLVRVGDWLTNYSS
jgi:pilus assembly protein Flp/PilA